MVKKLSLLLALIIMMMTFSIRFAEPVSAQSRDFTVSVDCSSATVDGPPTQTTVDVVVGQFEIASVSGVLPLTATYDTQPSGTIISVYIFGEVLIFQGPCTGKTGYNPGDGRVDPKPDERVVVYCRGDKTIEVWGIDNNSKGFPLTSVTVDQIVDQGKVGVRLGTNGTVVVKQDPDGLLSVEWYGSRYGNHAKCFQCELIQRAIKTRALQQDAPGTTLR